MKISAYVDFIAATALFSSFDRGELEVIFEDLPCSLLEYRKGSILHLLNDICVALDLVIGGKVSMQSVDADGNTLWIQEVSAGEIIGAGLLFAKHNYYPMMSVAESDVTILRLSKDSILSLCRHNTEFTLTMFQEVSNRTAAIAEQMHSIAFKSIRHRLRDLLMKESKRQQSRTITLPASQKQIAEQFGVQRQSLSRELNKMRSAGLLEYKNRTIQLLDEFFR